MATTHFEKVIDLKGFGYAYLKDDLRIEESNRRFSQLAMADQEARGQQIYRIFPETVGLDSVFEAMKTNRTSAFELRRINRDLEDGETRYIDLEFYAINRANTPIVCIIGDTTENTVLAHQIKQQQNEIRLLESVLNAQSEYMARGILGESPAIGQLKSAIEKMSRIPSVTVLLQGESGTGKSMVARVIHYSTDRHSRPFMEINCAAIPDTLLEAELFGYEKGAFTHAIAEKHGLLEEAEGGTIFLDEIGDLPLKLQAKLLSFLETRRFRRLGSTSEREVNARLIAATNRRLEEMVSEGEFREDLYYRLNVVKIELPALRTLGNDVLLIAERFIKLYSTEFKKPVCHLDETASRKLLNYRWPGNVRELRNVIERAMIFLEGDEITATDLLLGPGGGQSASDDPLDSFRIPSEGLPFLDIERRLLQAALDMAGGNQSRAARLLHLSRDAFRYRLEKHDLL